MRALIIGATGFVGRRLARELRQRDHEVAAAVRDQRAPAAQHLRSLGCELRTSDLADAASFEPALRGVDVVYYLAHLMVGDEEDDLVSAEAEAARGLANAAKAAGVGRVVYLGGLGDAEVSEHLRARHATALALRDAGPSLTYFRAAMVVGAQSGSYELLKALVERLPAMASPEWLENRTQPIGVGDVVLYLADAPSIEATRDREIQIGGPEVMTYNGMLEGMASVLGEKVPMRIPTPRGISAKAAGNVAGAVSRGDAGVARHITAGLATDTTVEDPRGMELFEIEPEPYHLALARALEDESQAEEADGFEARSR